MSLKLMDLLALAERLQEAEKAHVGYLSLKSKVETLRAVAYGATSPDLHERMVALNAEPGDKELAQQELEQLEPALREAEGAVADLERAKTAWLAVGLAVDVPALEVEAIGE